MQGKAPSFYKNRVFCQTLGKVHLKGFGSGESWTDSVQELSTGQNLQGPQEFLEFSGEV
jgi:hypothetical protein